MGDVTAIACNGGGREERRRELNVGGWKDEGGEIEDGSFSKFTVEADFLRGIVI